MIQPAKNSAASMRAGPTLRMSDQIDRPCSACGTFLGLCGTACPLGSASTGSSCSQVRSLGNALDGGVAFARRRRGGAAREGWSISVVQLFHVRLRQVMSDPCADHLVALA